MKNVIITGATGAIGRALVDYLTMHKVNILLIIRPESKRIQGLEHYANVTMIECDLSNIASLQSKITQQHDTFFHFAWAGTYGESRDDMYLQLENIRSTLAAVELAKACGCSTFLGAGSQAEYGRVEQIKIAPTTPTNPETGYGIAKLCAGHMSRQLCKEKGIRHIWTRILSIYGPYDAAYTMIMSGIRDMLNGTELQCTKGEQMWDYLYSKDAAKALFLAAEKGRDQAVYCIGSGQVRPLREYIEDMRNCINKTLPIGFGAVPYGKKQVMYLCADIAALCKDTGFVPEYSFKTGIEETVAWCRQQAIHDKHINQTANE